MLGVDEQPQALARDAALKALAQARDEIWIPLIGCSPATIEELKPGKQLEAGSMKQESARAHANLFELKST